MASILRVVPLALYQRLVDDGTLEAELKKTDTPIPEQIKPPILPSSVGTPIKESFKDLLVAEGIIEKPEVKVQPKPKTKTNEELPIPQSGGSAPLLNNWLPFEKRFRWM